MKIIAVGRNYAEHARGLNNPVPQSPIIFLKPDTAILEGNQDFKYPEFSRNVHFECELVYRVAREGTSVSPQEALSFLDAVGLGIDFTARDLQDEAKAKGNPWALAKGFDQSAPLSGFLDIKDFADHKNIRFELKVNGTTRQSGHSADMIFDIGQLLAYITRFITIRKGDLIFTGTPSGVGEVKPGDHLQAFLEGKQMLDFYVR